MKMISVALASTSDEAYAKALSELNTFKSMSVHALNRITKTINDLLYIAKAENKLIHRNDEVFTVPIRSILSGR